MNEANHPRGSPSAGAALAAQAESKDGDGGGVDPVALVALKQENKALKRSLADAQAAADQVRELQAQLAEAQAASNEGAAPSGGSPTVDTAALEEARSQVRPVLSWQLRCTHRSFGLAPALTWCLTCAPPPTITVCAGTCSGSGEAAPREAAGGGAGGLPARHAGSQRRAEGVVGPGVTRAVAHCAARICGERRRRSGRRVCSCCRAGGRSASREVVAGGARAGPGG